MPTYEIGLDDGRTLHIVADDQASALAGAQHVLDNPAQTQKLPAVPNGYELEGPWKDFQNAQPDGPWRDFQNTQGASRPLQFDDLPKTPRFDDLPPLPAGYQLEHPAQQDTASAPVTTAGVAKAVGAGALSGVVGLPGDFVALTNLARRGYATLTGGNYSPAKDDYSLGPNYDRFRQAADQIYTPKNTTEGWAKTIGEYLPAVATGPEGLVEDGALGAVKVLAKRAALQAAAPAIAAKAADTAAQGTPLEPYAGPAAALLTGGLTVRGKAPEVSVDAAKDAVDSSYDAARNAGVNYDANALATRAAAVKAKLNARGISELSAPSSHDTLDSFINGAAPRSLTELEEQRQMFTKDASKGGKEGNAAFEVRHLLDGIMSDTRNAVSWMPGASPAEAYATLQKGRQQALGLERLKEIEDLENTAQVGTNVHGTDPNKALKMAFGSALKSDRSLLNSNPDVLRQTQAISKGQFPSRHRAALGWR